MLNLSNNFLLTEREGRTGEYRSEVVVMWTERSVVRTKTTKAQYSPIRLELARLVSSLLYGALALNLKAFEYQKYAAYDCFYGNSPYGKIPTKKEPIRMLRFTSRLSCSKITSTPSRHQTLENNILNHPETDNHKNIFSLKSAAK